MYFSRQLMPYKEKNITKLYYSIGEVADMFDVNTSLIRFWEKEFSIIKPKKNKKGNRLFTPKDIENFHRIHHLVKVKGFTLDGAREHLSKKNSEKDVLMEVSLKLQMIKSKLENLKDRS